MKRQAKKEDLVTIWIQEQIFYDLFLFLFVHARKVKELTLEN